MFHNYLLVKLWCLVGILQCFSPCRYYLFLEPDCVTFNDGRIELEISSNLWNHIFHAAYCFLGVVHIFESAKGAQSNELVEFCVEMKASRGRQGANRGVLLSMTTLPFMLQTQTMERPVALSVLCRASPSRLKDCCDTWAALHCICVTGGLAPINCLAYCSFEGCAARVCAIDNAGLGTNHSTWTINNSNVRVGPHASLGVLPIHWQHGTDHERFLRLPCRPRLESRSHLEAVRSKFSPISSVTLSLKGAPGVFLPA